MPRGPDSPAQEILYSAENAYVTLLAGFTTIQSPGQANDVELREAIARGVLPGPRILHVDPPDQRAQRHGRRKSARRCGSSRPTAPTSSRSFASASIREGGKQTMTDEQLQAACGEANAHRRCARWCTRTAPNRSRRRSTPAASRSSTACSPIEEVLTLMADRGRLLRSERRRRAAELPDQQGEIPRHRQLQRGGLRLHGEGAGAERRR